MVSPWRRLRLCSTEHHASDLSLQMLSSCASVRQFFFRFDRSADEFPDRTNSNNIQEKRIDVQRPPNFVKHGFNGRRGDVAESYSKIRMEGGGLLQDFLNSGD